MLCSYAECHYAECRILFTTTLNAILLSVIMLNVIMLNVVMLSVVMLSVVAPKAYSSGAPNLFHSVTTLDYCLTKNKRLSLERSSLFARSISKKEKRVYNARTEHNHIKLFIVIVYEWS